MENQRNYSLLKSTTQLLPISYLFVFLKAVRFNLRTYKTSSTNKFGCFTRD